MVQEDIIEGPQFDMSNMRDGEIYKLDVDVDAGQYGEVWGIDYSFVKMPQNTTISEE